LAQSLFLPAQSLYSEGSDRLSSLLPQSLLEITMPYTRHLSTCAILVVLAFAPSCSYGPPAIEPPSISPSGAAGEAIELYDTNGDGSLADEELNQSPGIKAAMVTIDVDKDGKVTADEIAERIRAWQGTEVGVTRVRGIITMDGQPLVGATVTFEPEPFLADELLAGDGPTDDLGVVFPRIPKEKRPQANMPGGLQLGLYRVKISKVVNGKETVPAIYNTETTLGQQISPDDPALVRQKILFDLKGR
jgi:hypothetical protein